MKLIAFTAAAAVFAAQLHAAPQGSNWVGTEGTSYGLAQGPQPAESGPATPLFDPLWVDATLLYAQEASDPDPDSPWDKFSISVGGLLVAVDSAVRLGPAGLGVQINVEDALGLDTSTTSARIEGSWRFSENRKHRVDLSWIDLGRRGSTTLSQDLDLGDGTVLPVGATVATEFNLNLIKAQYSYSFLQDERLDLAGVIGTYVVPIDFEISASGLSTYSDSFAITAPLPLIGLRMDFLLAENWFLRSELSLFYVEFEDYTGSMRDVIMAVEYKPWKHVAMGLGVDTFAFGVERNSSTDVPGVDFTGAVDFGYTGLIFYLKGSW